MFNKIAGKLKGYALGTGTNPIYQNIADYGSAAALGVAGQQGANWLMGGADPNPLISGALMAPVMTSVVRGARGMIDPSVKSANFLRDSSNTKLENIAYIGSLASMLGGGLASAQNIAFGGNDIDNNIPAGILAGVAPLSAYLLSKHRKRGEEIKDMPEINVKFPREAPVDSSTTAQPRYSRNPSRVDLATGTYSRNPSRIIF